MEVAILSFFTRHDPFFHHAKFQLPLRPPSTFLGVFWNCWQILSSKIFLIFFLCKIWVIAAPNKHFLGVWYQKWMRNKLLLLHFFSTFLNPQRTTLTYSAMTFPVKWYFILVLNIFCYAYHGLGPSERYGIPKRKGFSIFMQNLQQNNQIKGNTRKAFCNCPLW